MKRCLNCMKLYQEQDVKCPFCSLKEEICLKGKTGRKLQQRFLVGTERIRKRGTRLYIGWDELFQRKVFIYEKVGWEKNDTGEVERFFEISQGLIHLDSVEEILKVWAVVKEEESVFQILEYPGELTLREVLAETITLSFEDVELLTEQVSRALQFSQSIGICHGPLDIDSCYIRSSGKMAVGRFQGGTVKSDIRALANLISCCLLGTDVWLGESMKEKIYLLRTCCPEEWFEVLRDILIKKRIPENMKRFIELLDGVATVEIH